MNTLLFILLLFSSCSPSFAQTQVTRDVLPDTNSADSTEVLNNNLRMQQNAINTVGGYFNSNGYLSESNGGTGANLSAVPNGSILIQDASNVGIGTIAPGTSGQVLTSNGAGVNPSFTTLTHGAFFFTASSGSWVAPTGVTTVLLTEMGAGGNGGNNNNGSGNSGGGGGSGAPLGQPYLFQVTPGNTYTWSVGQSAGTQTCFSTVCVPGGNNGNNNGTGGGLSPSGNTTTNGTPNYLSTGTGGGHSGGGSNSTGGNGGNTLYGTGGVGVPGNPGSIGQSGTGFGAGGAGAAGDNSTTYAGGIGSPGFLLGQY